MKLLGLIDSKQLLTTFAIDKGGIKVTASQRKNLTEKREKEQVDRSEGLVNRTGDNLSVHAFFARRQRILTYGDEAENQFNCLG